MQIENIEIAFFGYDCRKSNSLMSGTFSEKLALSHGAISNGALSSVIMVTKFFE